MFVWEQRNTSIWTHGTEKTWLASCAFKNTSRVNFFSQALYMTNAEIVFQPKTRMVNLSCKLSISLSLLPCDSKWLEMRLIYSSSIQTKHTVKLKIPSGLGNHIQLSFTYHPHISPWNPKYMAFGRFNSAEGLPFGVFESMKPTRKIGSRHNFFPMTDPWDWIYLPLLLFTYMFGWFLGFSCR